MTHFCVMRRNKQGLRFEISFFVMILLVSTFLCGSSIAEEPKGSFRYPTSLPETISDGIGPPEGIGPYRRELYRRINEAWGSRYKKSGPVVSLTLGSAGKVKDVAIIQSSGSVKLDKECIDVIKRGKYQVLPKWYAALGGQSLTFRIDMAKLQPKDRKARAIEPPERQNKGSSGKAGTK